MGDVIITNKALAKMKALQISEGHVMDTFNGGVVEKWTVGDGFNSVKKFHNYEIGVSYFRNEEGKYFISSVWKRETR